MIWLFLISGLYILGFGFTLARLAYDEWAQARACNFSRSTNDESRADIDRSQRKLATS